MNYLQMHYRETVKRASAMQPPQHKSIQELFSVLIIKAGIALERDVVKTQEAIKSRKRKFLIKLY